MAAFLDEDFSAYKRVAETRVELVPNCEHVPISELRLNTSDYGIAHAQEHNTLTCLHLVPFPDPQYTHRRGLGTRLACTLTHCVLGV